MTTPRKLFFASVIALCLTMGSGAQGTSGIGGKVTVEGQVPAPKVINMHADPDCSKGNSSPATTEDVIAGAGGALDNVVVYISAGAPDESSVPSQPVTVMQKGCRFAPHVAVMQTGQEVEMVNTDSTSHNVHPLATNNREWNKIQPPGTAPLDETFARPEFITVKCNIHPWMRAYFAVLRTSHYAITGQDGAFSLKNLPPGKYTVTAWHESLGSQSQEITVTGSGMAPLNFVFKAK